MPTKRHAFWMLALSPSCHQLFMFPDSRCVAACIVLQVQLGFVEHVKLVTRLVVNAKLQVRTAAGLQLLHCTWRRASGTLYEHLLPASYLPPTHLPAYSLMLRTLQRCLRLLPQHLGTPPHAHPFANAVPLLLQQDFMETPLDGGDIDLEGLQEIVIGTDHAYLVDEVMALVEGALNAAEQYKDGFGELRDRVVQNRSFSVEALQRELSAGQRDLEGFRRDIERYKAEVQAVQGIPQQTTLGVLRLVLDPMVAAFRPSFEACLQSIYSLLPQLANDVYTTFIDKVWWGVRDKCS